MTCGSVKHAEIIRAMIDNGQYKAKCEICGATITVGLPADFAEVRERMKQNADNEASKKS